MSDGPRRRRDAASTRAALLDAAERAFAAHGYEGARIDAIAQEAGYNKSLIFQHFGDKLGLYGAVLGRTNEEAGALQLRILAPLLTEPDLATDGARLRAFFTTAFETLLGYLLAHERLTRILIWEMASGWQAYSQLEPSQQPVDPAPLEALFRRAHQAGLIRSAFAPAMQLTLALQVCQTYLASAPLFGLIQSGLDPHSPEARRFLIEFLVGGIMGDAPPKEGQQ